MSASTNLPGFTCEGCGLCCHLQASPPFMPTELDVLPVEILRIAGEVEGCGPCSWLVGGKCGHYEHRPEVCRQFEMGGEECLEIRRAAGLSCD